MTRDDHDRDTAELVDESAGFSFTQLCDICQVRPEMLARMVAEGVLHARGEGPSRWIFASTTVTRARRACRLRRDLELDYGGLALALDLMEERDRLQRELRSLRIRLRALAAD